MYAYIYIWSATQMNRDRRHFAHTNTKSISSLSSWLIFIIIVIIIIIHKLCPTQNPSSFSNLHYYIQVIIHSQTQLIPGQSSSTIKWLSVTLIIIEIRIYFYFFAYVKLLCPCEFCYKADTKLIWNISNKNVYFSVLLILTYEVHRQDLESYFLSSLFLLEQVKEHCKINIDRN